MLNSLKTKYLFLNILLYLILINKILLLLFQLFSKLLEKRNILTPDKVNKIDNILHILFRYLMPLLLIILFNPFTEKYLIINHHIRLFLFIFGILQIIDQTKSLRKLGNNIFE